MAAVERSAEVLETWCLFFELGCCFSLQNCGSFHLFRILRTQDCKCLFIVTPLLMVSSDIEELFVLITSSLTLFPCLTLSYLGDRQVCTHEGSQPSFVFIRPYAYLSLR